MGIYKILTLDGGGSKGIYSLGVLHEVEAKLGSPLADHFDYFYGTSTGAIIAAALAKGRSVDEVKAIYLRNIPEVMSKLQRATRSRFLSKFLVSEFGTNTLDSLKKPIGIVTTSTDDRKVKIFKSSVNSAQGRAASFKPGWGFTIAEALMASCAATPFFSKANLSKPENGINFSLIDGGFSANNPTLFAAIDGLRALKVPRQDLRILNVGTGNFPYKLSMRMACSGLGYWFSRDLISQILDTSSNTTGVITELLLEDLKILRINDSFTQPELKTNLLENDPIKLAKMFDQGRNSFGKHETKFNEYFIGSS